VVPLRFGDVLVEKPADREAFLSIIEGLDLRPPVIIKPNWGTSVCFTEAEILDRVLTSVDGGAVVVESYGWARTEEAVKTGRLGSKKRGDLRKSDSWFLEYSGVGEVLERHGVEFLNLTEENWGRRTANPEAIREIVEAKHRPVQMEELYGFVPEKLYDLRGSDLLSLAKVKVWMEPIVVSFSVKNLFGMIPGPSRWRYHGKQHSRLSRSIVDVYEVYDGLFNIKGVVEAVLTASIMDQEKKRAVIHENPGFVAGSKSPLDLDAVVTTAIGRDPSEIGHLKLASETFGGWDEEAVSQAAESGLSVLSKPTYE
jgi:uncharacterized protein (DUF362 family)